MSPDHEALIRRLYEEGFNQGNFGLMDDIFTPDAVFHDPAYPGASHLSSFRQAMKDLRTGYDDIRYAIHGLISDTRTVAVRWIGAARYVLAEAEQKVIDTEGIAVYRFADDRVVESRHLWCRLTPEEAAERHSFRGSGTCHAPCPLSNEAREALIRRWIDEGISQGNYDLADEVFAPDFVAHNTGFQTVYGVESLKEMAASMRATYSDMQMEARDFVSIGDISVLYWTGALTQRLDSGGVPAREQRIFGDGHAWYHYAGDKIAFGWQVWMVNEASENS